MTNRFIVFDTETPNCRNNRMSAIGISVVENGQITEEFYTLVNPEAEFDAFNIRLTGITPESVETAPTFPQLWQEIQPLFESGMLVAHNAPFDMGVLAKCLDAYCIHWRPWARYVCTVRFARSALPGMPNYKLNTLCQELSIPLDHHNAGSDAHAAAELLIRCLRAGDVTQCIRTAKLTVIPQAIR